MVAKSVFITGASVGIGRSLALEYAAPGMQLGLVARRAEALAGVAAECRERGAEARTWAADVRDGGALAAAAAAFLHWAGGADLVIANAGGGMPDGAGLINAEVLRTLLELNTVSVAHTLAPFLPVMRMAGRGQLAVVASVAGYRGLPVSSSYAASKAALMVWIEGVRVSLPPDSGITITTICPGYVRTQLTANNPSVRWMIEPADAACRIRRGLERGRSHIIFPWRMALLVRLGRLLPNRLYDAMTRRALRERMRADAG